MRSHLLEGSVRHRRQEPFLYQLQHDVFYFALDLSELDEIARRIRLVSRNSPNLVSLRDGDHLVPPATDVDADLRSHLQQEGLAVDGWRITLVTNLRILGYVFNPASFYLCRDRAGSLRVVVIEVHNTHGERHLYTLHPDRRGSSHRASMDKDFYVSPFIDMAGRYSVMVRDDAAGLRITIDERAAGTLVLGTSVQLRRRRLTDRNLARMLLRHPFMTHRTMALIVWHGLRIWRRGAPVHHHGAAVR